MNRILSTNSSIGKTGIKRKKHAFNYTASIYIISAVLKLCIHRRIFLTQRRKILSKFIKEIWIA